MPKIIPLPAFNDNYIWVLRHDDNVVVVDPGDAAVVEAYLAESGTRLCALLITHHHADHTGGIEALVRKRDIPVYGPTAPAIAGVNRPVAEGDEVALPELGLELQVLEVPGHTTSHIAFHGNDILFSGDTLFNAGCGRLLGGTAAQLHASLERLKTLPETTRVYCGHEYTLANLRFSCAVEPDNAARDAWLEHCEALRREDRPTLPSTLATERAINPFLRTEEPGVLHSVAQHTGSSPADSLACFTALRAWKDHF